KNNIPSNTTRKAKAGRDNLGADVMSRIKMLIATGAVAGTLGGWALLAQDNAAITAQTATPQATVAALVQSATPTSTPQATATLQETIQALQATATATTTTAAATPTATPTDTTSEAA